MAENQNLRQYDLEKRTLDFARKVNIYVKELLKNVSNIENGKQLVRAVGSIGANYIEANEALSKKDFLMRIKISRKEARECRYWLELTEPVGPEIKIKELLINEATELIKILSSIFEKSKY